MTQEHNHKPKAGLHRTVRNVATNRRHFGLSHHALDYLRHAAECVSPNDLKDGRIPWCYERVDDMAQKLGVSTRSVWNIEKKLQDAGLIERRAMTNGYRGAKRCRKTGELLWAYGVSLIPLVKRQDEIEAIERHRLDRERAYRVTRNRIHATRARLKDALVASSEFLSLAGLRDRTWAIFDAAPVRLTRELLDLDDLARVDAELVLALDALVEAMEGISEQASEAGDSLPLCSNTSDASEAGFRHKYLTNSLDLYSCNDPDVQDGARTADTGDAASSGSGLEMKCASGETARNPESPPVARISPRKLLDLAPDRWRDALGEMKHVDWTVIGFVADARRAELGVSGPAWQAGVARMGPRQAALCLAILDTNRDHPTTPVRSVGGAFVAMTRRAEAGTLNLEPSVAWIATRQAGVVHARADA